jgi:hypothetical protein
MMRYNKIKYKVYCCHLPGELTIKEIATIIGEHLNCAPMFETLDGTTNDLVGDNQLISSLTKRSLIPFQKRVTDVL